MKYELIILAFCEGMMAAHHLCFFFLYTKHFNVDLLTYTIFEAVVSVLFCLNPFFGYISDTFSFCGSKKKSYLVLVGLVSTIGYIFCGLSSVLKVSVGVVFAVHFIIDIANAFRTVLLDSLCVILHNIHKYGVKNTTQKSSSSSVGLLFASRLFGKVVSSMLFGLIYQYITIYCKLTSLRDSGDDHFAGIDFGFFSDGAKTHSYFNQHLNSKWLKTYKFVFRR